jgi:hypothetical protein
MRQRNIVRTPRYLPAFIVVVAWLAFVVSFALPATNVVGIAGTPPGTPATGWQAFIASLEALVCEPLLVIVEPRTLLFLAFPFINFAMLVAPWFVLSSDDGAAFGWAFLPVGFLPWVLPKSLTGELFIGFHVWDLSFFAMFAGSILMSIRRGNFP